MKRTYSDRYSWGTLEIDYDYGPSEPMTQTYPGAPETLEITRIWYMPKEGGMVDLTPLLNEELFSVEALASMEERILESLTESEQE